MAEVAVAFCSNPQVSRPDIVTLRDDRSMIYPDRVVPVVRSELLRGLQPARRRRASGAGSNAASAALSTLALRSLNQGVIDGRIPEAVGGEFVDANGLGRQRAAPARPSGSSSATGLRRERDARATCMPRRCARAASA